MYIIFGKVRVLNKHARVTESTSRVCIIIAIFTIVKHRTKFRDHFSSVHFETIPYHSVLLLKKKKKIITFEKSLHYSLLQTGKVSFGKKAITVVARDSRSQFPHAHPFAETKILLHFHVRSIEKKKITSRYFSGLRHWYISKARTKSLDTNQKLSSKR